MTATALIPHALTAAPLRIKKGILLDMLPASMPYAERLKLARDIGFEVLQAPTEPGQRKAEELRAAAESSGIRIDSVMKRGAVREAFAAVNYTGSAVVELPAGDEAYLRDVSHRVDRLLLGA